MHLPTPCSRGNECLWDLPHGAIPSPRVQATCATAAMAYKHMSSQEVVRMDKLMKNGMAPKDILSALRAARARRGESGPSQTAVYNFLRGLLRFFSLCAWLTLNLYPLPPVVRRCAWLNHRVKALQTNKHWGLCPVPLQARNKHGACGA